MSKRFAVVLALSLIALALAACTGSSQPAAPTAALEAGSEAESGSQAASGGALTYTLVAGTEARFVIDEVLNGNPTTVIGATPDVEGTITLALSDPAGAALSPIRVDLSTLATDNNFRNRAIREMILQTGDENYRYAVFTPTAIEGLPQTAAVGETYALQITGDLTIHGTTRPATFEVTVTPVSEKRLEGLASLTIAYADFGVAILRLPPQVASVADQTTLELQFVAEAP